MAQRTVCLCDGKYIGIESIFTVVNGRQINIPDKVEVLREKSRRNELFCPCGCRANLILVAGDRNLREQHFRIKDLELEKNCHLVSEGLESVDSKIVLKCWLDDKLGDQDIESRVPIHAVDDINRKYEFTLLSRQNSVAVSYVHERMNLSDEKLTILENNSKDINIIYVVDEANGGTGGQYPERMMKIQSRQGYCLYLTIEGIDYYKATLRAAFFAQNADGFWCETTFANAPISAYGIGKDGQVAFGGTPLSDIAFLEKGRFESQQEIIKFQREQEARARAERIKKQREEETRKREERQRELQRKMQEAEKRRAEQEEQLRKQQEEEKKAKREQMEAFLESLKNCKIDQSRQVRDPQGNRWIQCKYCGKWALESAFASYGGRNEINLGVCYDCQNQHSVTIEKSQPEVKEIRKKYDPHECPECGGKLIRKVGRFGTFIGCSNYPSCRYTRQN